MSGSDDGRFASMAELTSFPALLMLNSALVRLYLARCAYDRSISLVLAECAERIGSFIEPSYRRLLVDASRAVSHTTCIPIIANDLVRSSRATPTPLACTRL